MYDLFCSIADTHLCIYIGDVKMYDETAYSGFEKIMGSSYQSMWQERLLIHKRIGIAFPNKTYIESVIK